MKEYSGRRDPHFVAVHRGGMLAVDRHRLLVAWAADCAEHVIELFEAVSPADLRPRHAVAIARAWSKGQVTVGEARQAASACHAAAREAASPSAAAVARAAGHAVATAHMADHELGAAGYALRALRLATTAAKVDDVLARERRWQEERLPEAIRDLVLSDLDKRAKKFSMIFTG